MSDLTCPYCENGRDVPDECHNENEIHEAECNNCGKIFGFEVSYWPSYSEREMPCKNGESHKWDKIVGVPSEYFKDKYRCEYCDTETKILEAAE